MDPCTRGSLVREVPGKLTYLVVRLLVLAECRLTKVYWLLHGANRHIARRAVTLCAMIVLRVSTTADRVRFEIEDECGGLEPGVADSMFEPFAQQGADRSGLGLGLAICLRGVEAIGGVLRVHDLPGKGCVFVVDLPRTVTTSAL